MMPIALRYWLAAPAVLWGLGGCAQTRGPSHMVSDISPPREARKQEVVRDFDQQRDQAQYQAAVANWEQGNLDACRKSLQALLARNPEHVDASYLLAELYFLNDQPEEARKILERLVQLRPDAAAIHLTLGMVLDRLGEHQLALEQARRAVKLEPDNVSYRHSLAALERGGNDAGAAQLAAYRQPGQSADVPTASPADQRAACESNQATEAFQAACLRGEQHKAKTWLLRAAREARDDEARLISLAVAALRQNQPAWAIQVLRTYQSPDAASAAYRRALGTAYYHAGDYAAAETQLRQALLLDNASALSYFLLGCTLSRQQRQAEADTHLRQARKLDSRFDRAATLP